METGEGQDEIELKRRLEHLRLMLKITTAVVAKLELRELLQVISSSIREVIGSDVVNVALFDYESNQLCDFATDATPGSPRRKTGFLIPLEGTPIGLAFTSGQPVLLDTFDLDRFPSKVFKQVYEAGYRSCINIPLIVQERRLGVLGCISKPAASLAAASVVVVAHVSAVAAVGNASQPDSDTVDRFMTALQMSRCAG